MSNVPMKILLAGWLSLGAVAYAETGLTPNLVRDGGMEQWNEAGPETWESQFFVKHNWQISFSAKGKSLIPSIFSQYEGTASLVKMETTDVFSGKHSLRFKGAMYLGKTSGDAYSTRSGDIYVVRFMAKGTGDTTMYFTVYGEGGCQIREKKGSPVADKWTLIEERILVGGSAPTAIYPRLTASAEMLIDDVFVGRVLREDEQTETVKVPKEYDERIAFASATTQAPVVDGKLDDECWKSAVPFSGFRLYTDQTHLAPSQTYFRALYDEKAIYLGIEILLPEAQGVLENLKGDPLKDSGGKPMDKKADIYTARHSVEIFIQPPGQSRYVQYVVSLDGYRYDGAGKEGSWNGLWTSSTSVGGDRWFLELMIPASDLKLAKIMTTEGWRLNITTNKELLNVYSTWSALGSDFHNPLAFGYLITKDFPSWRKDKSREWDEMRKKALAQPEKLVLKFADRLERTEKFTKTLPAITAGEPMDWEKVTRFYMLMNYVDAVYRGMDAEMRYADFPRTNKE